MEYLLSSLLFTLGHIELGLKNWFAIYVDNYIFVCVYMCV